MARYLVLSLLLCGHLGVAQECPAPQPKPIVIHVTKEAYVEASLKERLIRELTRSLIDEGRGIVDIPREREIQKLMKQLKGESSWKAPSSPDTTRQASSRGSN